MSFLGEVYATSEERFGIEKGMQQGEATIMLRLMARKYGVDVTEARLKKPILKPYWNGLNYCFLLRK